MSKQKISAALKEGPLGSVFAHVRYWKRRLRGEPLAETLTWVPAPLAIQELLPLAPTFADSSLLCYSLGRDYLDRDTLPATLYALACLRSAQTLGFASPERTRLFRGLAVARLNRADEAHALVQYLLPEELTASEEALRQQILQSEIVRHGALPPPEGLVASAQQAVMDAAPASLLVIGDCKARSATWAPDAAYICLDARVTGLPLAAALRWGAAYEVGVASAAAQQAAAAVGVRCSRWVTLTWDEAAE